MTSRLPDIVSRFFHAKANEQKWIQDGVRINQKKKGIGFVDSGGCR
jgi:hypothetical protein